MSLVGTEKGHFSSNWSNNLNKPNLLSPGLVKIHKK